MKRIAVLVSGGGTNLQALIEAQSRGEIPNGEIAAVISSKEGVYALERAARAEIPRFVIARKSFPDSRAMTVALVEKLKELNIDLVVLAGFLTIFTEEIVQAFPNAILNVHPALIPSFCGKGIMAFTSMRRRWSMASSSPVLPCILSAKSVTVDPSFCKRRWRSLPMIRRRAFSSGSWSSVNGSCSPRRWRCSAPESCVWRAGWSISAEPLTVWTVT